MNQVVELIKQKMELKQHVLVGISGISLSGKTSKANELNTQLQKLQIKSCVISIIEAANSLENAKKDKNPSKYIYENSFNLNGMIEKIESKLTEYQVVIIEGLLLFKNSHTLQFDLKIWLDCTFKTSINRAQTQDKELVSDLYMWTQRQHFSIDNPKEKVDIILKNDEVLESEEDVYVDLKSNVLSMANMKWLHEPKTWKYINNELYIETDPITDFWQRTHYGFRNDNAHFLYLETEEDFIIETTVRFDAIHQFDQCGLAVRIDEDNWLKTSIEYELENPPKLGAVVTNLGYSDWSTQELEKQVNQATFKITREDQDYKIEVKIGDEQFRQLRICHLHHNQKQVMVGIYCCSPIDAGYKVWFEDIKIKQKFF